MNTLHELDRYVRLQKTALGRRKKLVVKDKNGASAAVSKSLGRSSASRTIGRPRVLALSRPLDYATPGHVEELRQPSRMACWATTFTMMVAWRDEMSYSIEDALRNIHTKWVDLFKADTGSSAEQEAELFAASGLVAEPLASHTLESWEQLLRSYGPLAVIIDVDPSDKRAMHMVVMVGIHGDGTAGGTTATIVDPARGSRSAVKFSELLHKYEEGAPRRTASGRHNQIIHWPKDVKYARTKSFAASRAYSPSPSVTPKAPAAPMPWSHYFQFRKGSTFDVDGPLSYNGKGEVLDRTPDFLKFSMKMPGVSILGQEIPAADMVLNATYKKEGKGNHVAATINGVSMEDPDAEIISSGHRRTIRPKFTGFSGPMPEWVSIEPDGADEIDLDMRIDGRDVDFDLNRTSGSSGLALAIEPWSKSFPFGTDSAFIVKGPASWDGNGRVLERTDTVLRFEIAMPSKSIVIKTIPALALRVEVTYVKEGPGNQLTLTVNGAAHIDSNATVISALDRRTISHSIKVPDTEIGQMAFVRKDADNMQLNVIIDKTARNFDFQRQKGAVAKSWVRGMVATSSMADAVKELAAFGARTGSSRWKLSRADVAKRLTELVKDPDLVDQGGLNLCGPAAFFHLQARRDPLTFARYGADLFEKGSGTLGALKVKPDDDLVLNDYAKVVPRMIPVTPVGEWMCLSALRDSENAATDFEGDPDENVAGMTTPGELADWMKASGMYSKVTDEGNWVITKDISHAKALRPASNRDIVMLINASILTPPHPGKKKLLDSFPNHYIQLLSPVTVGPSGMVEFDYWTWGVPGKQHVAVTTRAFSDNYYGSITGEA